MKLLVTGNIGYITTEFIKEAFPECQILLLGELSLIHIQMCIRDSARGQQLLTGDGEKLTIVDKLGDNLSLVGDSFSAKNLKDNSAVRITPKYNPETKIIEIEIPDKTPVEITYSATVNVVPDTDKTVNVTNEVYWKSYSSDGGATNTIKNYSYTLNAGGSTESTAHPVLTIKKTDPDDVSNKLTGVKFNIYECELVDESIPVSYTHLDVYKRQGRHH